MKREYDLKHYLFLWYLCWSWVWALQKATSSSILSDLVYKKLMSIWRESISWHNWFWKYKEYGRQVAREQLKKHSVWKNIWLMSSFHGSSLMLFGHFLFLFLWILNSPYKTSHTGASCTSCPGIAPPGQTSPANHSSNTDLWLVHHTCPELWSRLKKKAETNGQYIWNPFCILILGSIVKSSKQWGNLIF